MYVINQLPRPTLITASEVVAMTAMEINADTRYVLESIITAEERFIVPAIGDAMYEDICGQKNIAITGDNLEALTAAISAARTAAGMNPAPIMPVVGNLVNAAEMMSAAYQTLWNRFLWKITAECVHCIMLPDHWLRTTAQGQTYNNPKSLTAEMLASASGDIKDVKFKIDHKMQSVINPLLARMEQWLTRNAATYPLYPVKRSVDADGINVQGKGGMAADIYRDGPGYVPQGAMYGRSSGEYPWRR